METLASEFAEEVIVPFCKFLGELVH